MDKNRTITNTWESRSIIFWWYFDARRERVFKIYTDPDLVTQWWGSRNPYNCGGKNGCKTGRAVANYSNGC